MRQGAMSAILVLCIGANGCTGTTVGPPPTVTTAVSADEGHSLSASQLLETMQWPSDLRPIALSPSAKHQLQRFIFDDIEIAAAVSDVTAVGLVRGERPIGAILLVGVTDPVIGNMTFVEGLRAAALKESDNASWGPMAGSVMSAKDQIWGVLPLGSVVVVGVGANRSDLDDMMNALVHRVTR